MARVNISITRLCSCQITYYIASIERSKRSWRSAGDSVFLRLLELSRPAACPWRLGTRPFESPFVTHHATEVAKSVASISTRKRQAADQRRRERGRGRRATKRVGSTAGCDPIKLSLILSSWSYSKSAH